MARTKTPVKTSTAVTKSQASKGPLISTSQVPSQLRFPLLVASGLALSSLLYTAVSPFTKGDLATVSGFRDEWWQIGGLLAWKAVELAVGWWGGYDTTDLAALVLLSHLPYQFFLVTFYKIRPTTATTSLTVDIIATSVPFYLLRDPSAYHKIKTPKGAAANRTIIDDFGVQTSTSLLAAGIYGLVVFGSFGTWLPSYLVTHFEGIRDISALYNSTFVYLVAYFAPTGFAAKTFLFTPAMAAKVDGAEEEAAVFDPAAATLWETVQHNFVPRTKRVRTLAERTIALITISSVHTWLHTYGAVQGAEGFGAVGWSSVWALAAALTSIAFSVVGNVE